MLDIQYSRQMYFLYFLNLGPLGGLPVSELLSGGIDAETQFVTRHAENANGILFWASGNAVQNGSSE